jgi:nicotinamide mononucleotide transporter
LNDWIAANWFEAAAAAITAFSIWLAAKENVWYYPTGLAALVMYTWIYFGAKLYAESLLQVVCFGLMVYGWYEWLHGGANKDALAVSRTPRWAWKWAVLSGIAGSAIVVAIQLWLTDNPNPYVDSSLFVWSLAAQWMTARKWLENWILWVLINTVSVPLYVMRELWFTSGLYVALWILAVVGYFQWRKSLAPSGSR